MPGNSAPEAPTDTLTWPASSRQIITGTASTLLPLLERMCGVVQPERRFTDDAAHELRTPLAAVKVHLQVVKLTLKMPDGAVEFALMRRAKGVGMAATLRVPTGMSESLSALDRFHQRTAR